VPQKRLAVLREAISSERFFELRKDYCDLPVDGPASRIEVRLLGRLKRVSVYSIKPQTSKREAAEVDRAVKVWSAIQECFQLPPTGSSPMSCYGESLGRAGLPNMHFQRARSLAPLGRSPLKRRPLDDRNPGLWPAVRRERCGCHGVARCQALGGQYEGVSANGSP
jgi:hypothetical protein